MFKAQKRMRELVLMWYTYIIMHNTQKAWITTLKVNKLLLMRHKPSQISCPVSVIGRITIIIFLTSMLQPFDIVFVSRIYFRNNELVMSNNNCNIQHMKVCFLRPCHQSCFVLSSWGFHPRFGVYPQIVRMPCMSCMVWNSMGLNLEDTEHKFSGFLGRTRQSSFRNALTNWSH